MSAGSWSWTNVGMIAAGIIVAGVLMAVVARML